MIHLFSKGAQYLSLLDMPLSFPWNFDIMNLIVFCSL